MKMMGEEIIAAPRQLVWDALNDPDVLKKCIAGCEEIKKKSDTEFDARVIAKVGPVKAAFTGNVKLSKLNPPRSYVISGEGKGGMAGFAKGGATVRLSDTGDHATKLAYDVDAQVGGKLAQIGSRLIDSTARKMAADFFNKFNKTVSQMAEGDDMAKKPAAKKAATKKPATKKATVANKAATKTASKSTATVKKAATKTASKASTATKTATKKATKSASKATATVKKAATKTASKTSTATKTAVKKATKSASKAVFSAQKASSKVASKASDTVSKVSSSASDMASKASAQAQSTASSAASNVSAMATKATNTASNNMPPEVKSMSGMWMWVMLAAAAGLVILWATGK